MPSLSISVQNNITRCITELTSDPSSSPLFPQLIQPFSLPCLLLGCVGPAKATSPPLSLQSKPINPLLLAYFPPQFPKSSACQSETVISAHLCFFWMTKLNNCFLSHHLTLSCIPLSGVMVWIFSNVLPLFIPKQWLLVLYKDAHKTLFHWLFEFVND